MISRLNEREQKLALLAVLILGPILLLRGVLFPLLDWRASYEAQETRLTQQVRQVRLLGQELQILQRSTPQRSAGLGAQVAQVLRKTGVTGRASSTSQGAEGEVQRILIQVDQLTLTETSALIYQLEHLRPAAHILTLDIQKSFQDTKRLKLNLVVSDK